MCVVLRIVLMALFSNSKKSPLISNRFVLICSVALVGGRSRHLLCATVDSICICVVRKVKRIGLSLFGVGEWVGGVVVLVG